MKHILHSIIFLICISSVHATINTIKIGAKLKELENITITPSLIVKSGEKGQIAITKKFIQDSDLSLPVGVTLDTVANIKDGKICYSVLLTIRESIESSGNTKLKAVSAFKTRELMLSGVANSGDLVTAKLDEQTTLTISLEVSKLAQ